MGDISPKRYLHSRFQSKRASKIQKITGTIILCAILFLKAWGYDYPFAAFDYSREWDEYYAGVYYQNYLADIYDIKGRVHSYSGFSGFALDYGLEMTYKNLGNFDFVESQDYAYRSISTIKGSRYSGLFHSGFHVESVDLGGAMMASYQEIGTYSKEYDLSALGQIAYQSFFGNCYARSGLLEKTFYGELGYGIPFHLEKMHFGIFAYYEYFLNRTVRLKGTFQNYQKDLSISIVYKLGLEYGVYDFLTIELGKRLNEWEISLTFSPSSIENNLFGFGITCYFSPDQKTNLY